LDEINFGAEVQMSLATYMRLAEYSTFWDKKILNNTSTGEGMEVRMFCARFKKGSKQFRKSFYDEKIESARRVSSRCLINFENITGTNNLVALEKINGSLEAWNLYFLPNRMREFLFKYIHNLLGVNARIARFNVIVNASCTFCRLNNRLPAPSESFVHVFFECEFTDEIRRRVDSEWWPDLNAGNHRKNFWLAGSANLLSGNRNKFLQLAIFTVQYYIWECKLKKQTLGWSTCKNFTVELLKSFCKISSLVNNERNANNSPICRMW
jgi:hypothetical protein